MDGVGQLLVSVLEQTRGDGIQSTRGGSSYLASESLSFIISEMG